MFKHTSSNPRYFAARLLLAAGLLTFLVALPPSRGRRPEADGPAPAPGQARAGGGRKDSMPSLQGAQAREYLEERGEYQSLMQAVTAARFGLKWQERSPFGDEGEGYLGMSHVQNLNAWFGSEGVTIRPTLPEEERDKAWRLGMRLKAYGYGARLQDAPPIASQKVKENRIEYERASDFGMRISDFGFLDDSFSLNPQSAIRNWLSGTRTARLG